MPVTVYKNDVKDEIEQCTIYLHENATYDELDADGIANANFADFEQEQFICNNVCDIGTAETGALLFYNINF